MTYNLDTNIIVGDPAHIDHHVASASAINDLDTRVVATLTKTILLLAQPDSINDPNHMELYVSGVLRTWWNEWRALRGRNPYTTWADALVRAVVETGDNTAGNALEIQDRRTGAAADVLWGVNWGSGRVTQGDNPVGMVYTLEHAQTEADIPSTLPVGTLVVRKAV